VVAHAFVTGGLGSESERDITIGGVDSVSADLFDGFAYTALGHLHGPQNIHANPSNSATSAADSVIAYSGSPLRYSFSEARQRKGLRLVDIDSKGSCSQTFVPLTQPRAMAELRGELSEVTSQMNIEKHSSDWLRVTITDETRPTELNHRIRELYPHVLAVIHEPAGGERVFGSSRSVVDLTDPVEISRRFVADVTASATTERDLDVLRAAYEAARVGGDR
ncbi:MAG: exonuclease SbcCD subunit D C-terminal domain-containing protein, partial [Actinobacteria bacterium]|nr:exonuclease SbcCD subunit D C-terminal domain-containing protein [Actinomycetota bacterium]